MNKITRMAIVSIAAIMVLAACGDDDATTTTAAPATTTTAGSATTEPTDIPGEAADVAIAGFAFVPQNLTVAAGDTVRWTNADPTTHTVTAAGGEFNSSVSTGATFEHTFETAGEFDYFCSIHGTMTGTITVEG